MRRQKTNIKMECIEFTSSYSAGPILTIIDERNEWIDGKPTRTAVIPLPTEVAALDVLAEARKAVEHHREMLRQRWKGCDDALKEVS